MDNQTQTKKTTPRGSSAPASFFFIDDNKMFSYSKLRNAVRAAEKRILSSLSGEIRIFSSPHKPALAYVKVTSQDNYVTVMRNRRVYSIYKNNAA